MNSASSASPSERVTGAARLCWAALGVFALAITGAAWLYPGGSWTEPRSEGFSPLRNFWCDLVRTQAINGADNSASRRVSCIAFAALALALWWFWPIAGSLLAPGAPAPSDPSDNPKGGGPEGTGPAAQSSGSGALVSALGRLSTLALFGMALLPSDAHPIWHGVVALAGGGLGMTCAALCCARRSGEARHSPRLLSACATLLLAALNAALYIYVAYAGGAETLLQPSVQKLATLALMLWMSATLRCAAAKRELSGVPAG